MPPRGASGPRDEAATGLGRLDGPLVSVREVILMACLAGLGTVSFRERRAETERELGVLLRRERALAADVAALRRHGRALRREADALERDRYYVERLARADLGWRPGGERDYGPLPPLEPPSALVQGPPSLPPTLPSPIAPQAQRPPAPQPPSVAQVPPPSLPPAPLPVPPPAPGPDPALVRQAIASLGYTTPGHFQTKMMGGRSDGRLDDATLNRARQLTALIRQLGYSSVKAFQERNRLVADGIMGRRTEQRALELLRRRTPRRPGGSLASNGRDRSGG